MTDKVQKIREEVERLFNHVKDSDFESDSGAFYYLKGLLDFIDSLQEEPVSNDFEMALAEMIDKAQTSVVEPLVVAAQWKDELIRLAKSEKPVSKDYRERYKRIAQSEAFKKTYEGMSIGEVIPIEGEINIPQVFDEGYWEKLGEEPVSEDLEKNKFGR